MPRPNDSLNDRLRNERAAIESEFSRHVDVLAMIAGQHTSATAAGKLREQLARLRMEQLEVMVAGRFKVGKSTLLNTLLCSSSMTAVSSPASGPGDMAGLLPVDNLPCTAVLTRVVYAEQPYVRAIPFEGEFESWSLADYVEKARIYGENAGSNPLDRIRSFEIGLPVELLRNGLSLWDSPGISEDPRRTALTREAVSKVHAALVLGRSDMLFGLDEIAFIAELLDQMGHAFPVVNMFHGQSATDRFKAVLAERLARIRAGEGGDKLDDRTHYVDCEKAFRGYVEAEGAYHAKVRGAVSLVVIAAALLAAITGGAFLGGALDIERRVRDKALDAVRPMILEMMRNEEIVAQLTAGVGGHLRADARSLLSALDSVLDQQEEQLRRLEDGNNRSLDEKRERLAAIDGARATLTEVRPALAGLLAHAAGPRTADAA